jgi:hypothetical protein
MRLRMPEARQRRYNHLVEATDEASKSKALDRAAGYYLRMRGNTDAHPTGAIEELLATAEERGSLTGAEIADILNCPELPLQYEVNTNWEVG